MASGGGGGQQTVVNSNVPDQVMPEYTGMVKRAWDASNTPYQAYDGQRIADFTPMQYQAMDSASQLQTPGQFNAGSNMAYNAGQGPSMYGQQGMQGMSQASQAYNPYQAAGMMSQSGQMSGMGQMGANYAAQAGQRFTDPGVASSYMSPYMDDVVQKQVDQSNRDFSIQRKGLDDQAIAAGGLGGYRNQLMQSEAQANQNRQNGNIRATGYQNAYNAANQAFNSDQSRQLQSGQALLGADTSNRQLMQQAGQGLGSLGMQANQNLTNADTTNRNTNLQAASTLGSLGSAQNDTNLSQIDMQNKLGSQQQALAQQNLSQQYQDFQNQQNWNWNQLGLARNILSGTNLGGTQTLYGPQASGSSQLLGGGLAGLSLYNLMGKGG